MIHIRVASKCIPAVEAKEAGRVKQAKNRWKRARTNTKAVEYEGKKSENRIHRMGGEKKFSMQFLGKVMREEAYRGH